MARRKAWNDLTATYRSRLETSGITRHAYESGAALSQARGHAATPERPTDAIKNPERYRTYLDKNPHAGEPFPALITSPDREPSIVAPLGWTKRDKSTIARHWNALRHYAEAEQDEQFGDIFAPFQNTTVGGNRGIPEYELETRKDIIRRHLNAHTEEPYETLYEYAASVDP